MSKIRCTILFWCFYMVICWANAQSNSAFLQNRAFNRDVSSSSSEEDLHLRKTHRIHFPTITPSANRPSSISSSEDVPSSSRESNCNGRSCPMSIPTAKVAGFASNRERPCTGLNCIQAVEAVAKDEELAAKRPLTTTTTRSQPARGSSSVGNCNGQNCVRNSTRTRSRRICEIKYAEYMTRIFPDDDDQADANDSQFNGRDLAEPGEYPHMTALGFKKSTDGLDFKCGGSLISERFVITAAHCTNLTGQQPTSVRIGDLNLLIEEKHLEPQRRTIRRIYNHPLYKPDSYYYDIALLELSEDLEFTEFVRPIRLWVEPEIPYATAFAMGYGATAFGKARTHRLTDLNMTIVPNSDCDNVLPSLPETQHGIIESQICTRDYAMNRDTCQGDSGGPLQLNLFGRRRRYRKHYLLIGITSYGLFCRSEYPSVSTRVSSFLDWIEQIVWDA